MTREQNIQEALFTRVRSLFVPKERLSWPNRPFTRPADGSYFVEVSHLPNQSDRYGLTGSDPENMKGILQLNVRTPLDKGSENATNLAGQVALHFPADLALWSEGVKVTVSKTPDLMSGQRSMDGSTWDVPVTVWYSCSA